MSPFVASRGQNCLLRLLVVIDLVFRQNTNKEKNDFQASFIHQSKLYVTLSNMLQNLCAYTHMSCQVFKSIGKEI